MKERSKSIPTILDTDIGGDIDDTWALAMMLKSPELNVRLVVSDTGDTRYRSKIIARMLEVGRRTDIPVGVGMPFGMERGYNQTQWVENYDLLSYPGTVHEDGVEAIINTIMRSPEPITLICIGPVPNIGEALRREPRIVNNTRFVGMQGSVYKGYGGSDTISAECNVGNHTPDCQMTFTAGWDITITPLDTCGLVALDGEKYQLLHHCQDPLVQAVMENYRIWLTHTNHPEHFDFRSSTLFDTVAIYLAFSKELLVMKDLGIRVTDDGYTVVDENAKTIHVAVDWKDLDAFKDFLVSRLTGTSEVLS